MKTAIRSLSPPRHSARQRLVVAGLAALAALVILVLALLANASLLALNACAAPLPERFVLRSERVEIGDLAGSVRIVQGTGTQTEVLVTRAGRDADQLRIRQDERGGTSRLRVLFPGRSLVYPGWSRSGRTSLIVGSDGSFPAAGGIGRRRLTITSSGRGPQAWADVEVRMPRGHTAIVHLGVGGVAARGVDGDLTLDVAAATVSAEGTGGRLAVDAGSGSVTLRTHRGDVTVDTGSGHVDLAGIRGGRIAVDTGSGSVTAGRVEAEDLVVDTGSGGVRAEGVSARSIRVDTGSGGVSLDLAGAPATVVVDTGSGGVSISGPPDLGAQLELETGSGGIEVGYTVSRMKHDDGYLRGTIGDGRASIRVDTGSGAVRLSSR